MISTSGWRDRTGSCLILAGSRFLPPVQICAERQGFREGGPVTQAELTTPWQQPDLTQYAAMRFLPDPLQRRHPPRYT